MWKYKCEKFVKKVRLILDEHFTRTFGKWFDISNVSPRIFSHVLGKTGIDQGYYCGMVASINQAHQYSHVCIIGLLIGCYKAKIGATHCDSLLQKV